MNAKVILFARSPVAGLVKQRLAKVVGSGPAAEIYRQVAEHLFRNLESLPELEVHYSPAAETPEIINWQKRWPAWAWIPQTEGDLGARLVAAMEKHFQARHQALIIIGSDCPAVTKRLLDQAEEALESSDLVLGPAEDGGYWLIGIKRSLPQLFENISWGELSVYQETMLRARSQKLITSTLPSLYDIDTFEDWRRFCTEADVKKTKINADR